MLTAAGIWRCCWIENWFKSMEEQALGSILWSLLVSTFIYVIFRVQRRLGTLRLWNLLSGSNRSSSQFRESELTAEGQEHMKMMLSYEDNWIWQRLIWLLKHVLSKLLATTFKFVTSRAWRPQCVLSTIYAFCDTIVCLLPQWGDDLWPHSWEGSKKPGQ